MPTKTITIDTEAYDRLRQVRRTGESISRTIKRVVPPPLDVDAYLLSLEANTMSEEAGAAIEEHMKHRHTASTRKR